MSQGDGFETGSIRAPAHRRVFRHVGDFMGQGPIEHAELFAGAPWHDPVSYRDEALIT